MGFFSNKSKEELIEEISLLKAKNSQLEKALKEKDYEDNTEKFREIIEHSRDIYYRMDFETEVYDYISPSVYNIFGCTTEEIIGMDKNKRRSFIHADDLPQFSTFKDDLLIADKSENAYLELEFRVISKTEKILWISGHFAIIRDHKKNPKFIVGVLTDITEMKKAIEKISESEKQYRVLFNLLPFGGEVIDTNGIIVKCSSSTSQILGYKNSELIGKHITKFLTKDSIQLFKEKYPSIISGKSSSAEICMIRKDGTILHILRSAQPIFNKSGKVEFVLALNVDITKRVKYKRELEESEAKYRNLIERANDGILILQDGIIVFLNARLVKMWGGKYEEIMGSKLTDYIDPKKNPDVIDRYYHRIAGMNVPSIYEVTLYRKDGHKLFVELNAGMIVYHGKPANMVFVRDISKRIEAQKQLKESEEYFRTLIENASDVISIIDKKGIFVFESFSAKKVLGYNSEEFIGKNAIDFVHHNDRERISQQFAELTTKKSGESTFIQFRFKHKNDSWRYFEGTAKNLLDTPNIKGIVINHRDVTERIEIEQELAKQQDLLEEKVKERTKEIEKKNLELQDFNKLFVGREFRIKKLRDRVKYLEYQLMGK